MVASETPGLQKLSKLTLSFLEDTGWYKPNYESVDDLVLGKNEGCNSFYKKCH